MPLHKNWKEIYKLSKEVQEKTGWTWEKSISFLMKDDVLKLKDHQIAGDVQTPYNPNSMMYRLYHRPESYTRGCQCPVTACNYVAEAINFHEKRNRWLKTQNAIINNNYTYEELR